MRPRTALAAIALTLAPAVALAGCSSDDAGTATAGSDSSSTEATSATTGDSAGSTDGSTSSDTTKVDANTATVEEMTAAFEAAGIANAAKWAHEVEEYRPYDTDDPEFTHLREELAKYNPSDETVNQIISTLTL